MKKNFSLRNKTITFNSSKNLILQSYGLLIF